MDTSKFTSDKEAGDGYRDYRKACQAAFDDINVTLEPKPKINKIMPTAAMGYSIVDKVGACVGVDNDDNPVWTDPRAANLKPDTIELYSFLVSPEGMAQMGMVPPEPVGESDSAVVEQTPEVAAAEAAGLPDPALAEGPKFVEDGKECPGWVNKTGPNPQYKETCDACSRVEACAAQAVAKADKKPKKTAEEKEAEKAAKVAEREARKAAKAAAGGSERYGYVHAFRDAIRSGAMSRKDLVAKTLELYLAKGNTGDLKQAERNVDTFLRPLFVLEIVTEVDGTISLVE